MYLDAINLQIPPHREFITEWNGAKYKIKARRQDWGVSIPIPATADFKQDIPFPALNSFYNEPTTNPQGKKTPNKICLIVASNADQQINDADGIPILNTTAFKNGFLNLSYGKCSVSKNVPLWQFNPPTNNGRLFMIDDLPLDFDQSNIHFASNAGIAEVIQSLFLMISYWEEYAFEPI